MSPYFLICLVTDGKLTDVFNQPHTKSLSLWIIPGPVSTRGSDSRDRTRELGSERERERGVHCVPRHCLVTQNVTGLSALRAPGLVFQPRKKGEGELGKVRTGTNISSLLAHIFALSSEREMERDGERNGGGRDERNAVQTMGQKVRSVC